MSTTTTGPMMADHYRQSFGSIMSPVTDPANVDLSLLETGLNFDVSLEPVTFPSTDPHADPVVSTNHRAVWFTDRLSHARTAPDAIVGTQYRPIQNSTIVTSLLEVLDATEGLVRLTMAGSLKGGLQAFAYLTVNGVEEVNGDPFQRAVLLTWAHDGSRALSARTSNTRLACWNQVIGMRTGNLGRTNYGSREFVIRHTTSGMLKVEQLTELIARAASPDGYEGIMVELMGRKILAADVTRFLEQLLPVPHDDQPQHLLSSGQKAQRTRALNARAAISDLVNYSPTNEALRGTAAALWHSAIEYVDHVEGNDPVARGARLLNNSREAFKVNALEVALAL